MVAIMLVSVRRINLNQFVVLVISCIFRPVTLVVWKNIT